LAAICVRTAADVAATCTPRASTIIALMLIL
jgi:hypothetical protein